MFKHSEQRILPYKPQDMLELVLDVAKYHEFLPWCLQSRVLNPPAKNAPIGEFIGDLVVGHRMIHEKFASKVQFNRQKMTIDTAKAYINKSPLQAMDCHWQFHDLPDGKNGCMIDFAVSLDFQSVILRTAFSSLFDTAVAKMVNAFENRAKKSLKKYP